MENNFQFSSASVTDRGLSEKRPQNEDSFLSLEKIGVFAVADGVGGAQAGDVASQMAMEILAEAFVHYVDSVDPEEIMKVAIERANEAIFQMASDLPQLASMATTVAAIHLSGNIATIAHVGDSRVYRVDPEGTLFRETDDHSVVEEEVRAGRMTPEQALTHPSRNVISRAVGAESTVEVDVRTIMVDPGTMFLICSDGITRHIPDDEIEHLLTTGMNLEMLCQQMKDICFERGAEDNLTAVVVRIEPENGAQNAVPWFNNASSIRSEEETIASSRSPFESPAAADTSADLSLTEGEGAEVVGTVGSGAAENDLPVHEINVEGLDYDPIEQVEYKSSSVIVPAKEAASDRDFAMFGSDSSPDGSHGTSGSAVSTILTALVWLVLGGILGIVGYYIWHQNNPIVENQPVPTLIEQSSDPQVSSIEDGRRLVDADPVAYANSNAATPQDAADFYLLGRALMLSGKYAEAGNQFELASRNLNVANAKETKTLAADIAIARAILANEGARAELERNLATRQLVQPRPESNTSIGNLNASPQP